MCASLAGLARGMPVTILDRRNRPHNPEVTFRDRPLVIERDMELVQQARRRIAI